MGVLAHPSDERKLNPNVFDAEVFAFLLSLQLSNPDGVALDRHGAAVIVDSQKELPEKRLTRVEDSLRLALLDLLAA